MLRKLIRVWIVGIVFPLYAIAGQPSVKITHGPYFTKLVGERSDSRVDNR